MSWLAVLLVGVGVTDLVHSVRPVRLLPECAGAAVAVLVGLLAGLTDLRDLVALVVIAGVVVLWGQTVTRGFGRGRAWLPLLVLALAVAAAVVLSGLAGAVDGVFATWLDSVALPVFWGMTADGALMLLGVLLVQLSTGNVLVRLVLDVTGTVNPIRNGADSDPELALKGGRLLGPMERVFIVGLGLAGHLTAAAIVIAAKGLLRFPELNSPGEAARIHRLTEYFLVGSFVSWLVALSSLLLLV